MSEWAGLDEVLKDVLKRGPGKHEYQLSKEPSEAVWKRFIAGLALPERRYKYEVSRKGKLVTVVVSERQKKPAKKSGGLLGLFRR